MFLTMTYDRNLLDLFFISDKKEKYLYAFILGVFVSIFLGGYLPFEFYDGASETGVSFIARVISFGICTTIIFSFNELITKSFYLKIFKKNYYSFGGWLLWEFFTGTLATFLLYNYFWAWFDLKVFSFFKLFLEYSAMMIIPVAVFFLVKYQRTLHLKLEKIEEINNLHQNPDLRKIKLNKTFYSSNKREEYNINLSDLLFIKSEGNYIKIHFLVNDQIKSHLIRTTLKTVEEELQEYPFLVKCHRTFIVNTRMIKSYFRKNQNITLTLPYQNIEIPVSKKYVDTILPILKTD